MRHRVAKNHFNRNTNQRKALLRELVRSLVKHGVITTTKAKAKEVKRLTDKLVGKALINTVASRRQLHRFFGKRDVVNVLVEKIAPLYKKRKSGFTTLESLGKRRGDNTELVKVEFINKPEKTGSFKSEQKKQKKALGKSMNKSVKKPAKKSTKSKKKAETKGTK